MSTRLLWQDVPYPVRGEVSAWLGAEVVGERSQPSGFSPGVASRLVLADGRRVFLKAVGAERNPDSPSLHRREATVMGYLPGAAPTPRLLKSFDNGDWVVLVLEDVDGVPPHWPWRADELARVMRTLERLAEVLTPAPPGAPLLAETMKDEFTGWRAIAADPRGAPDLDPWALAHLDQLAGLETGWAEAARGDTLLHADLRDDNLLLTTDGRVVVVDWPHAAVGAAWCDALFMMPSAAMGGTVDPEDVWMGFGPGRAAPAAAVNAVLAALTGYFVHHANLPAPRNVPGLRAFQAAQGAAGLAWLRRRVGDRASVSN